jgi:hypothetical protein
VLLVAHKIKVDHCYRLESSNGLEVILRVDSIFQNDLRFVDQLGSQSGAGSFIIKDSIVRFKWRHAKSESPWSSSVQQMGFAMFALLAIEEVPCE